MDVSSKYYAQLTCPGPRWIRHLWKFLIDIRRVGKVRELLSFALWEVTHHFHLYRIRNRYVRFTDDTCLSVDNATHLSENIHVGLAEGLYFQPIAVDWKYYIQGTNEIGWGCRFSDAYGLYHTIDQSESAVLIHTFRQPISSLFISQRNGLFICTGGTIYKSDDGGNSFRVVLHLSTPISYFLFNNGMTELPDHTLLIGEYGSLWHGKTWLFCITLSMGAIPGKRLIF